MSRSRGAVCGEKKDATAPLPMQRQETGAEERRGCDKPVGL